MKKFTKTYNQIIEIEDIFSAWKSFVKDKSKKPDVIMFGSKLMDNVFDLYTDLVNKNYVHSKYGHFKINDPKPRDIHKASVRDRVLHHLLYNELYPFFDSIFIYDSYSCRFGKGTHKGIQRFRSFVLRVSKNRTKQCFVLKCDIRKFFANINHAILKSILEKYINDVDIINLLGNIIDSFKTNQVSYKNIGSGVGLPLGNLTSQLLVNIYMNEFDQFIKRELKIQHYIRYVDDFVIVSDSKQYLENILPKLEKFLMQNLKLQLHPGKVFIKTIYSGVDFLGWVEFGGYRVLRNSTKHRMFRKLKESKNFEQSKTSYAGMLGWGNGYKISKVLGF